MKRYLTGIVFAALMCGCSSYNVTEQIDNVPSSDTVKKAGVVFRTSERSRFPREDIVSNFQKWLAGYDQIVPVAVIPGLTPAAVEYNATEMRFFQSDDSGNVLKYKSVGVVRTWIRAHETELRKAMTDNQCDLLFVYEVYGVMSPEMQIISMDSSLVILNTNLEIIYLDGQYDRYNVNEFGTEAVARLTLDKMSIRLVEILKDRNYIKEID